MCGSSQDMSDPVGNSSRALVARQWGFGEPASWGGGSEWSVGSWVGVVVASGSCWGVEMLACWLAQAWHGSERYENDETVVVVARLATYL